MTKFSIEKLAPLDAPVLTGDARAVTAATSDSDTSIATTAFVQALIAAAGFSTGDAKLTLKNVADPGWVMMDDGSIGDASSGATNRANADTQALYVLLWTMVNQTWAPVAGGRGASALADFNAHKYMRLPQALGRSIAVAGAGAGLTARALGSAWGAETDTPTVAKTAVHAHGDTGHTHGTPSGSVGMDPGSAYTALTLTAANVTVYTTPSYSNITSSGSSDPVNILDPSVYLNVMIRL